MIQALQESVVSQFFSQPIQLRVDVFDPAKGRAFSVQLAEVYFPLSLLQMLGWVRDAIAIEVDNSGMSGPWVDVLE